MGLIWWNYFRGWVKIIKKGAKGVLGRVRNQIQHWNLNYDVRNRFKITIEIMKYHFSKIFRRKQKCCLWDFFSWYFDEKLVRISLAWMTVNWPQMTFKISVFQIQNCHDNMRMNDEFQGDINRAFWRWNRNFVHPDFFISMKNWNL